MATATKATDAGAPAETLTPLAKMQALPPVINLGKVKPKDAKKLKKGKPGKLTNNLDMGYQQIKAGVDGQTAPVYISYEVKPRTKPKKKKKNKINVMGLKIDRKKLKSTMKKNGVNPSFL